MALNIKNPDVEQLAEDVAEMTGETKTEAVRRALAERKSRLELQGVHRRRTLAEALDSLQRTIWSTIPSDRLGRPPLSREEEDAILGYGPEGV